jgi:uncharacterized membrane protein YeaQ/YmgE (transglycosylase-associated protein family)
MFGALKPVVHRSRERPFSGHHNRGHMVCRSSPASLTTFTQPGGLVMNFIIWIVIGGLIGWVASMIMKTDAQQGIFLNIVVGIVGALLGGWLISPLVGIPTINQDAFSIGALIVSLIGAIILLAIVNLFRRGAVR